MRHNHNLIRQAKLDSIKDEAQVDIAEFRDTQQQDFERKLEQTRAQIERQYAAQANDQGQGDNLEQLEEDYNGQRDEVISRLIGNVMTVDISIPRVVKGNFEDEEA